LGQRGEELTISGFRSSPTNAAKIRREKTGEKKAVLGPNTKKGGGHLSKFSASLTV